MEEFFSDEVFDGKTVERFNAFDYKIGNILDYFKILDGKYKNTKPEYACLMSHLGTLTKFSKSDLPDDSVALIFEDDATLEYKKHWKKTVKEILNSAPEDWEIIMLNYHFDFGYSPNVSLFEDFEFNSERFFSALSYIVKKSSAKGLINEMYKNNIYYIDSNMKTHHADGYLFTKLKTYIYKYPYFTYKTENTSYLHPEHVDNHKRSKLHIQKLLYDKPKTFYNSVIEKFISKEQQDNAVEGFTTIEDVITTTNIEENISLVLIVFIFILLVYFIYMKKKEIVKIFISK
jgi:GR25 family glycosyltransferase involved in LPS biosynthesis